MDFICKKCNRKFNNKSGCIQHQNSCKFDELKVKEAVNVYLLQKISYCQLFKLYGVNAIHAKNILQKQMKFRKRSEQISITQKKKHFHHTIKTRTNLSKKRKEYLRLHPYENAWKHGTISYGEKLFMNIVNNNSLTTKYDVIREFSFFPYFLDFAFVNIKLNVEIDGTQHFMTEDKIEYDKKRDNFLISKGWKVYRIPVFCLQSQFTEIEKKFLEYLQSFEEQQKIYTFSNEILKYKELKIFQQQEKEKLKLQNKITKEKEREDEVKQRFEKIKDIDFSTFGWLTIASERLNLSHTQVRRFLMCNYESIFRNAFHKVL